MDPFQHLPSELRDLIIVHLEEPRNVINLCHASPAIMRLSNTRSLLGCWMSLHKNLDWRFTGDIFWALSYPKVNGACHSFPNYLFFLPDPLFTSRPGLILRAHAVYERIMDRIALGPDMVPTYKKKYSKVFTRFGHLLPRVYGAQGQNFPTTLSEIDPRREAQSFRLLLAMDLVDNVYPITDSRITSGRGMLIPQSLTYRLHKCLSELLFEDTEYLSTVHWHV